MKNTEGICTKCKEWTDAKDSCCGAAVWVDGSMIHPDSFQEKEEENED